MSVLFLIASFGAFGWALAAYWLAGPEPTEDQVMSLFIAAILCIAFLLTAAVLAIAELVP